MNQTETNGNHVQKERRYTFCCYTYVRSHEWLMVYTIFCYGCWLVGPMNSPRTRILQIFYNRRPASSVPTKRSKINIIENPQTDRKVCGHYMILNHDFTIFDLSIFLLVTSLVSLWIQTLSQKVLNPLNHTPNTS